MGELEATSRAQVVAVAGAATVDFDDFYRRERPALVALLLALTGPATAEDVAQEALLRAHRDWDRIGAYDKPGAWVRRVALNLATSSLRRRRSERRAVERLGARPIRLVDAPEVHDVWSHVRRLPRNQAVAVALHYLDDASAADVAAVLGCGPGTAKTHLRRGRAALAAALSNDQEHR